MCRRRREEGRPKCPLHGKRCRAARAPAKKFWVRSWLTAVVLHSRSAVALPAAFFQVRGNVLVSFPLYFNFAHRIKLDRSNGSQAMAEPVFQPKSAPSSSNDEWHAIDEMRIKIEALFASNEFDAVMPLIDPFLDRFLKNVGHELDARFCMMLSMVGNGLARMGHEAKARPYLERAADSFECRDENLWHVVTLWEDLGDDCIRKDASVDAHRMAQQVEFSEHCNLSVPLAVLSCDA
jgi:hypothetical protein